MGEKWIEEDKERKSRRPREESKYNDKSSQNPSCNVLKILNKLM